MRQQRFQFSKRSNNKSEKKKIIALFTFSITQNIPFKQIFIEAN